MRIKKDEADVEKLEEWFQAHTSFPDLQVLMSIATGVTGESNIICHNSYEKGYECMEKLIGCNFNYMHFKRSVKVLPLQAIKSTIILILFQLTLC